MNMNKSTEERPITLNDKLKELNLWSPGLRLEEARKRLLETDEFKNQKMAIEALAERHGCLVMFLPCAHPVLNPIERYWRLVKMTARKANSPTQSKLAEIIDRFQLKNDWCPEHLGKMFELSRLYRRFFYTMHMKEQTIVQKCHHVDYSRPAVPSESQIQIMDSKGKIAKFIPTEQLHKRLGKPVRRSQVNIAEFGEYLHTLNTRRVLRGSYSP